MRVTTTAIASALLLFATVAPLVEANHGVRWEMRGWTISGSVAPVGTVTGTGTITLASCPSPLPPIVCDLLVVPIGSTTLQVGAGSFTQKATCETMKWTNDQAYQFAIDLTDWERQTTKGMKTMYHGGYWVAGQTANNPDHNGERDIPVVTLISEWWWNGLQYLGDFQLEASLPYLENRSAPTALSLSLDGYDPSGRFHFQFSGSGEGSVYHGGYRVPGCNTNGGTLPNVDVIGVVSNVLDCAAAIAAGEPATGDPVCELVEGVLDDAQRQIPDDLLREFLGLAEMMLECMQSRGDQEPPDEELCQLLLEVIRIVLDEIDDLDPLAMVATCIQDVEDPASAEKSPCQQLGEQMAFVIKAIDPIVDGALSCLDRASPSDEESECIVETTIIATLLGIILELLEDVCIFDPNCTNR